jgi:hypothetical protein
MQFTHHGYSTYLRISIYMKRILLSLFFVIPITPAGVNAADTTEHDSIPAPSATAEKRPWTIGLPIWVPGYVSGRFTVGGTEIGGESEDDNLFDQLFLPEYGLEFYLVGLVNYRWQQWKFHFDIFGGLLSNSVKFTLTDKTVVDGSIQMIMPHIYAGYNFLHDSAPLGPIYNWQVYAGSRLYSTNVEMHLPENSGDTDDGHVWLSVLIGTELEVKIVKRVYLQVTSDIGGAPAGSKWAYFGQASLNYQPWDLFSANFGLAVLHLEVAKTDNPNDLAYNLDLLGPVLGVAFHF